MLIVEPKTLKGFKDYKPEEAKLRQKIIEACRKVFELYGFQPLETPALEYAEILEQKYGEDEKLIYKFEDRGGRMVGLRYDLTVPLARYVAENLNSLKLPFRRYQIGPAWRAENPQKGRFREFIQADADVVGVDNLSADAECIALYDSIWKELGLKNYEILINTRTIFVALGEMLEINEEWLQEIIRIIDKIDKIGIDKVTDLFKEMGLSDGQLATLQGFLAIAQEPNQLSALAEFFSTSPKGQKALEDLQEIEKILKVFEVKNFRFDVSIARGLDYYTDTVFECRIPGSNVGSIGGGGRYNGLVEKFLDTKLPAVGMSVGVDRILSVLLENKDQKYSSSEVLVMNLGSDYKEKALEVLKNLRQNGISAQYFYEDKDLDKQFKYAESQGIKYAVIIGEEELGKNLVQVKNLQKREQEAVANEKLSEYLKQKIA